MAILKISRENFVEVEAKTLNVHARYRIVSEDKNRFSYWSPLFEIVPPVKYVPGSFEIPGSIVAIKNSGYATLAWDAVTIYGDETLGYPNWGPLPAYDVWIQFGSNSMSNAGPWIYKERIFTTSVNIIVPPTYTYTDSSGNTQTAVPRQMKVEIHRAVRPLIRYSPDRLTFSQGPSGVDLINNTITFAENHGLDTGDAIAYYLYNAASAVTPLTDGSVYWVRKISGNSITLHTSDAGATNNTNIVDLTAYGQGAGVLVVRPFLQSTAINTTNNQITLPYTHDFQLADPVIYNALTAAAPLTKENLYFVRPVSYNTITLHSTKASAILGTSEIDLTNTGSGYATLPKFRSLLYKTSVAL